MTTKNPPLMRHPASIRLSLPSPEFQVDALEASISQRGVQYPIVLHEGMVLDGWLRLQAALKHNAPYKTTQYNGDKTPDGIDAFLLAVNLHRRHYTALQRALLAARVLLERRGIVRGGAQPFSTGDAAKMFSVSQPYVNLCVRALASKSSMLIRRIENGVASHEEINEALPPDQSFNRNPVAANKEPDNVIPLPKSSNSFIKEFKRLGHAEQLTIVAALKDLLASLMAEAAPAPKRAAKR